MPIRAKWRPFKDAVVELAPEQAGVYELGISKTSEVLYIGSSSTSIQSRLRDHRKHKDFTKVTDFRFKLIDWPSDALKLERELCNDFKKKHDGNLPRLQKRAPNKTKSLFGW